jgi:uracil-DNA glycosylase
MADEPVEPESLRQQVLAHLVRLRLAGIDWLPKGPPLVVRRALEDNLSVADAASVGSPRKSPAPGILTPAERLKPPPVATVATTPIPAAPGSLGLEERRQALKLLAEEVQRCTRCAELCSTRTQTVFGDGAPGVELCFVGEAPGADEDRTGIPFVGEAGQMLNRIITGCGLRRDEVYICNILRCRPPGNRTPLPEEAVNCRGFLERQIELVRPKFLCALGGCAATNLLQMKQSVASLRGRFHSYKDIPLLVTYHPSYLLRNPAAKREVWDDMQMLLTRMGRPIPKRGS